MILVNYNVAIELDVEYKRKKKDVMLCVRKYFSLTTIVFQFGCAEFDSCSALQCEQVIYCIVVFVSFVLSFLFIFSLCVRSHLDAQVRQ